MVHGEPYKLHVLQIRDQTGFDSQRRHQIGECDEQDSNL